MIFQCTHCQDTLPWLCAQPLCENCREFLLWSPSLCQTCGKPDCLTQAESCLRPWQSLAPLKSLTAVFLLTPSTWPVLRTWKKKQGGSFDLDSLVPKPIRESLIQSLPQVDLILPFPQSPRRRWELRASTSLKVAEWLLPGLDLPLHTMKLKTIPEKRQAQSNLQEKSTRKLEFEVHQSLKNTVTNRDILLVDDFVTTGRSLKQAANFLVELGARRIHGFALGVRPSYERRRDTLESLTPMRPLLECA